ncbi:beta-1,6-N-acetylglucosaminyltransferase [Chitinophaga sp.]|uniref:beta-1,6-N-acetylglucosaminyltransferase n=1 Tax=Chitinophaga sp. TaxID=1869181 RepID=UPI002D7F20C6|nr:beta-1,6-N-acetylglucosaminyltransferase [Chitinophaga sp.]
MKIAYLIIVHHEFEHFRRLLKAVQHSQIDLYIHVDKKCETPIDAIFENIPLSDNTYILEDRVDVAWGGYGITAATLNLLEAAMGNDTYDYFFLLSGQDFPLCSSEYILRYMHNNRGREFIEHFPLPDYVNWAENGGKDRYEYFWPIEEMGFSMATAFVKAQQTENVCRSFPAALKPYGGSNWFAISLPCVEYLFQFLNENTSVLTFFRYTKLPEELMIQSIVLNSPFREKVVNNNLRYIDWCTGPGFPRVLDESDLSTLLASGCLFARKFSKATSNSLIDIIEDLLPQRD